MKRVFKSILSPSQALVLAILALSALGPSPVSAQDSSSGNQPGAMLSSLSLADKMKFLKARRQVLADNPDLKAEQDDLAKQRQAIQDQGSNVDPDDKQVYIQSWKAHEKKMKDAMLQVDPSLSPVFDQIDQKIKEKLQQHASQPATTTAD